MSTDTTLPQVNIRSVPLATWQALRIESIRQGVPVAAVLTQAMAALVREQQSQRQP